MKKSQNLILTLTLLALAIQSANSCSKNCRRCSNNSFFSSNCQECYDRYYLESQSTFGGAFCKSCYSGCETCTSYRYNDCTSCVWGNYLSGRECKGCHLNCGECTSSSSCQKCKSGYDLKEGTCEWNGSPAAVFSGGIITIIVLVPSILIFCIICCVCQVKKQKKANQTISTKLPVNDEDLKKKSEYELNKEARFEQAEEKLNIKVKDVAVYKNYEEADTHDNVNRNKIDIIALHIKETPLNPPYSNNGPPPPMAPYDRPPPMAPYDRPPPMAPYNPYQHGPPMENRMSNNNVPPPNYNNLPPLYNNNRMGSGFNPGMNQGMNPGMMNQGMPPPRYNPVPSMDVAPPLPNKGTY